MAMRSVTKLGEMTERLAYLAAIEAMIAAQAVDLRVPDLRPTLGVGARRAYDEVRRRVPILDEDRPLGPDIDVVAAWVAGR